jgi:hypothetical protein
MLCPLSRIHFQSYGLSSVYGIVFLQLLEAAADGLAAYDQDAGGWSQPETLDPDQPVNLYAVASNLPALTDALSKYVVALYLRQK